MNTRRYNGKNGEHEYVIRLGEIDDLELLSRAGWFAGGAGQEIRQLFEYSLARPGQGRGQLVLAICETNKQPCAHVWVDTHTRPSRNENQIGIIQDLKVIYYPKDGLATQLVIFCEDYLKSIGFHTAEIAYSSKADANSEAAKHIYKEKLGYVSVFDEPQSESGWELPSVPPFIYPLYQEDWILRKRLNEPG